VHGNGSPVYRGDAWIGYSRASIRVRWTCHTRMDDAMDLCQRENFRRLWGELGYEFDKGFMSYIGRLTR
jgi:hypothetical protein